MRYQLELEINAPRDQVVAMFLNVDSLHKWQPDFISHEQMNDVPARQVGAKARQVHKMGKRQMAMIETITAYDPPAHYAATYEADGVWNLVENHFIDLDGGRTRWELMSEFKCTRFMMKVMTKIMPGMFKRQTMNYMTRFRAFVEADG